jgi:integrase
VLRSYERALRRFVLDDLGAHRLSDIRRGDLQALVDRLLGKGLAPATVRNIATALRVIFRHAVERDELAFNPAAGLRLPNGHKPRDRAASATEAADLLAALPESDRPLWATAFYAGLRRGELRALRWEDVDLAGGIIHVRHGWDDLEGEIAPKSRKGTRTVPITALLRDYLVEHKARTRDDVPRAFVFGSDDRPFSVWAVREHALKAWERENEARAEKSLPPLKPILLHECRHTFVSLMADAGIPLERVGDYVGHSSTWMVDRYRHLLEGHEQEAARLLDEYLARADSGARIAQLEDAEED